MSNALTVHLPDGEPFMDCERIDLFEPQTGSSFRFLQSGSDGGEHTFRGVFHFVREDDFVLQTFEYEGYPDAVSLEYSTFMQLPGGRCKLSGRSLYPSVEARDQMASSGMEGGMSAGHDQFAENLVQGRLVP